GDQLAPRPGRGRRGRARVRRARVEGAPGELLHAALLDQPALRVSHGDPQLAGRAALSAVLREDLSAHEPGPRRRAALDLHEHALLVRAVLHEPYLLGLR